ncbi:MAG: Uncharacterised protein [Prochlorococcus marinus str. MIT 9313]|nr:MAG: Uncharacterised protein [Prochlorococcus marinus str. MIT 9313]
MAEQPALGWQRRPNAARTLLLLPWPQPLRLQQRRRVHPNQFVPPVQQLGDAKPRSGLLAPAWFRVLQSDVPVELLIAPMLLARLPAKRCRFHPEQ